MSESQAQGSDWTRAWIEQQRALLHRLISEAGPATTEQARELASHWVDAGFEYLRGLAQFSAHASAGADAAASASSRVSEELVSAWRSVWAGTGAGREANERFAHVLGRLPPLGIAREHTEAWRELARAQREYQELEQALRLELARVQAEALNLLEQRMRGRDGKSTADWRELYDLWVECGEQAFAALAHSEAYAKLQAELSNAALRLRARVQALLERSLKQFDLPTRSELNTVHRQLRDLRARLDALETGPRRARDSGDGS